MATGTAVPSSIHNHTTDRPTNKIYINNIYIRARARETVRNCFASQLGYWPSEATSNEVEQLLDDGADVSLICAVIEYTARTAPRPTWRYACTVVRRQLAAGVTDADGFNAACAAFWAARKATKAEYKAGYYKPAVQEQAYHQRQYDPAEYDEIPSEQMREMEAMV